MLNTLLVSSAIKIAADILPSLATKIAGKNAEKVARDVVDTAVATLGIGKGATPEQVIQELHQNEAKRQELRLKFEQLDNAQREAELEDIQNAREYQRDTGSLRGNILLGCACVGLLLCIGVVWAGPLGDDNFAALGLITTVAGAFLKMISDAFAFEFGSSRGSKSKEATIAKFQTQLEDVGLSRMRRGVPPAPASTPEPDTTVNMPIAIAEDEDEAPVARRPGPRAASETPPTQPRNFVRQLIEGNIDTA